MRPKHNTLHVAVRGKHIFVTRVCVICGDLFETYEKRSTKCCSNYCRGQMIMKKSSS